MSVAVSVVIPAHNEERVIGRLLARLLESPRSDEIEIVVVVNGSTDRTAEIAAASSPAVTVVIVQEASKIAALNAGDAVATAFPRVYLDADVEVSADAVLAVAEALAGDEPRVAAPRMVVSTVGAGRAVKSYYRVWERTQYRGRGHVGSGLYAVSEAGRRRWGTFPDILADDLLAQYSFAEDERISVADHTFTMFAPRSFRSFLRRQVRLYEGNREFARRFPGLRGGAGARGVASLGREVATTPGLWLPALVYTYARIAPEIAFRLADLRGRGRVWRRDETSRIGVPVEQLEPRALDHVLLTRFNLPSQGVESVIRAQDGWLRDRVELFERYTVPSVRSQTVRDFYWIVYLDPQSPAWLTARLQPWVDAGVFTPVHRETVETADIVTDAARLTGAGASLLLTTNLDNDDALARDFVARLHSAVIAADRRCLYLADGLILDDGRLFRRRDRRNAFVSVVEPWAEAETAWCDWHTLVPRHMPVTVLEGRPGWLQVIHGRNVSNRIRGRLVEPRPHRREFPGLLEDTDPISHADLIRDRLVARPLRETKEAVRAIGKRLVLGILGKASLDRLKNLLGAG